jgi:hypothetical protein
MSSPGRSAALLLCLAAAGVGQTQTELVITPQEGAGAVVPRSALSSRRFAVLVTAADGRPISQATVSFRLPEQGATGAFSSGLRSESVMTDGHGLAYVRGILWGDVPGALRILVTASYRGQHGEAFIPVEISATAKASAADRQSLSARPGSGAKRWLILAAVAGGALAGVAVAGGRSAAPVSAAPPVPAVIAPSIGSPSITIGRP